MEPPAKKQRKQLLDENSDESGDEGGVAIAEEFPINKDYARRFEYNKKREELQQLENKLGTRSGKDGADDDEDESEEESDSETEDDAAELVTEAVDSEILATIQAIRNKDPRVYDKDAVFYTKLDEEAAPAREKEQKPMYLRDYHREKLLQGADEAEEDEAAPKTYVQEQEELKQTIVKQMHAAVDSEDESGSKDSDDDDTGFLVRKSKPEKVFTEQNKITEKDVAAADKDPETFLSNFMASRAWVPTERSNFQPFESDDDEEEARAEAFEEAYNLRFEDPNKLNEALVTHARDTTSKFSVRREENTGRKRKRELERQKKEEERQQRHEERARLRKLKIEELEEKIGKIKTAAGIRANDIKDEDWAEFLDDKWDDDKWEKEMAKRFGEQYYAEEEAGDSDGDDKDKSKRRRIKKPSWDDDIDIKDILPDFKDDEEMEGKFELSDLNEEDGDENEDETQGQKSSKRKRLQDKKEKQKDAKRERRKIEQLVDQSLNLEKALLPGSSKKFSSNFRYRETSPVSFGLTARDILIADDSQLNQFAGLKKLAAFRPLDKKQRDQKKLGKKARLRQWRKDTFGDENGPELRIPEPATVDSKVGEPAGDAEMKVDIREGGKKKRKRSKKH